MGELDLFQRLWKEHRSWTEKGRQALAQAERELVRLAATPARREVLTHVYWADLISPSTLGLLLGVAPNQLEAEINPKALKTTCVECEWPMEVMVRNRTHLLQVEAEDGDKRPAKHRLCPPCAEARQRYLSELRLCKDQRLTEAHKHTYKLYLQSDEWKMKRDRALRRSKYRCQLCNKQGRLEVHHRTYVRLGEERPEDLICLCSNCHGKHHDH